MLVNDFLFAITIDDQRLRVFDRICSIEYVISFIHIFLEDTKYLESLARILKKLLSSKYRDFMSQHFNVFHNEQTKMKMQMSKYIFENRTSSFDRSS